MNESNRTVREAARDGSFGLRPTRLSPLANPSIPDILSGFSLR